MSRAGSPATGDQPGLPSERIGRWLEDVLGPVASTWRAELISGGLSNITYRLRLADETSVILRRPPLGGVPPSAHDMEREFRVLRALSGTAVPVPQVLALCTDPAVLERPFYIMADIAGKVVSAPEDGARLTRHQRTRLAEDVVETLAAIHAVDIASVGLSDFGYPHGYTNRQVRRWRTQWSALQTRDLPDMTKLLDRLAQAVPARTDATIVHGDYRLDNTIVHLPDARIAAVIDWELSTLGDPLTDLGMLLTYWHDLGDDERQQIPVAVGITAHPGFPTGRELAQRYAELTGRDLSALGFYRALGAMKLAVILEGVRARHRGGHTVSEGYEQVGDPIPTLVASALSLLGQS